MVRPGNCARTRQGGPSKCHTIRHLIVTEGNKVNEAVKTVVKSTIDSLSEVDTTGKTAEYVDQAIAKTKDSVTSMLKSAIKKTIGLFASLLKRE